MDKAIKISELPMQNDGSIYHLNIKKEHLAGTVILVGDPGRVETISSMFDKIEHKRMNREIITHTGVLNQKRISVMSTGMGPDNIDIVINELDAVVNIDFDSRTIKEDKTSLNLIRIGTCGSIREEIPVDTVIASSHGLGMDGLLYFYQADEVIEQNLTNAFIKHTNWSANLPKPYIVKGSSRLMDTIAHDMIQGITCTAPGFYGPQGRVVRLPIADNDLNKKIETFAFENHKICNLEMETSALYGLSKALGHESLTVCLAIANRVSKTFSKDYKPVMSKLIETVLNRATLV
jgi:uridine phosphorylase